MCLQWLRCHTVILFAPPPESSTYSDSASHPAPSSSSPSRKPWETKPACQSRAAWGKMGVSWRQTALRPCTLAPPTDMAPPSPWCPPTSHRNQKLTLCLKPSYPKFRNTPACASQGFGPEKKNNSALGRKKQTKKKDVKNCKQTLRWTFWRSRASRIRDALTEAFGEKKTTTLRWKKNHVEDQITVHVKTLAALPCSALLDVLTHNRTTHLVH